MEGNISQVLINGTTGRAFQITRYKIGHTTPYHNMYEELQSKEEIWS